MSAHRNQHELQHPSHSRLAAPVNATALTSKFRSFLAQRAEVSGRVRGRRHTPGSLLLNSFRSIDVGNKNECSFDDFSKAVDSTVPWPDVQELWELWNNFFDTFCVGHGVESANCSSLRYLLFVFHHCGQEGLTIADISSISHETQMQLNLLGSVSPNEGCSAPSEAASDTLPAVPHVVAQGVQGIISALLSSSFTAAFDRCRTLAVVKSSRTIASSAWLFQAIAEQHVKGEGSVCVLLLTLLLNEADVRHTGTVPFEQLCQFMRAFQVTLSLTDQKSQALVQYFSSAEGGVGGFGKQIQGSTPIYYRRLLAHVRGRLPPLRQQKLHQLFEVLDRGGKGFLSIDDVSSALQYSMVPAEAIGTFGYSSAMQECSEQFIDLIVAVSSSAHHERSGRKSVSIPEFVEFFHALSSSISRNAVFFTVLYKMWERGLENPGELLDSGNLNFRPSKVFDAAVAATHKKEAQGAAIDGLPHNRAADSPSKPPVPNHHGAAVLLASPDGFLSRLQSPKFLDESNFSSRKGTPRVSAFDGAAGVSSVSVTNSRIYSHLNRGSNHLPVQYDPEIDGLSSTVRRCLAPVPDEVHGASERGKHEVSGCAGVFARIRGLLHQEHATNKYKSSHKSSLSNLNPMKFVSRWNNFIWIAANVVLEDARACAASASGARSRSITGTVTVAGFAQAMMDSCIYLSDSELSLLGREFEFKGAQPDCLKYPEILKAWILQTNQSRESKKHLLWQGIEGASGFRGRVPFANFFKAMNVGGHPLVTSRMCDAGEYFSHVIEFVCIS